MAYETPPNIADQRRKQLVQKLMGQQGGRAVAMPAAAEGPAFHSVGRFGGLPRVAQAHASSVAQAILNRLGGGLHPGMASEVSPGSGLPIGRPLPPAPPHPSPVNPPIPPVNPPGVNPLPPTGPVTPAAGSEAPPSMVMPTGGVNPAGGGGVNPTPAPAQTTLLSNADSGANAQFVPLGNGLYYDPATDSVISHASAGTGGAARRL